MAAIAEMGEVDDIHSKEDGVAVNGDVASEKDDEIIKDEEMQVDETGDSNDARSTDGNENSDDGMSIQEAAGDENSQSQNDQENESVNSSDCETNEAPGSKSVDSSVENGEDEQVKNVESAKDNDPLDGEIVENDTVHTVELNDSGEDVVIVDGESESKRENGDTKTNADEDVAEVINLDTPTKKKKSTSPPMSPPRRSTRNLNKQKSYIESDKEEEQEDGSQSEESDIEEVLPQDPLDVSDPLHERSSKKSINSGSAIVVKDTKRLVEIAAKSSPTSVGGKKEPTLVIIDTNSILSGRGPVPLVPNKSQIQQKSPAPTKSIYSTKPGILSKPLMQSKNVITSKSMSIKPTNKPVQSSYPMLPMALPAQGVYPPNMRATITPIPMNNNQSPQITKAIASQPPVLPTLTDDMFVVEAPSFIVPYVYEKPPLKDFKDFVKDIEVQIKKKDEGKSDKDKEKGDDKETEKDSEKEGNSEENDKDDSASESSKKDDEKLDTADESPEKEGSERVNDVDKTEDKLELGEVDESEGSEIKKTYSYFDSPLGKFFVDIGTSLVQEYVQTDLLKQQKRKREREGGQNSQTLKTIQSLVKNLEFSKENNSHYKMEMKKCEFCSFKTESGLAMAFHLETPHMKNYVYRCNFCSYEVRSPHDILFHMEAEHAVRGRLERAPAFHQCPNCPFEDNQKGKLTRHLVACMRKFKPDRNLEPPIDWEPPAKIPRVPRMKQQSLNTTASVYQALAKNPQYQMFSKMQQATSLMRGRGRPTIGSPVITKPAQNPLIRTAGGMMYKQTMSGGSVLVPTSYQLSGNQLYQVVGGQELGGRIGPVGSMAFVPNMSSSTVTIQQQQQNSTAKKPVHQPSISITPLPRGAATPAASNAKPGDSNSKNSFVICEICDGYIKDLEQLRNHMQWIHKVKIHPKMIYNRPPLNCQKCQFRFFTDQGLERHLLGSHGLVTSSMQEAANKSKDAGRCPVCGRVYQWKLLNHVARDHNMTLKPAHLSYKCTVCTATFGMYKQFENHVYSAHSVVAKRVMDKKSTGPSGSKNDVLKPLKINDEITIIPQPAKGASTSKEGSPSDAPSLPGTSKSEHVARGKTESAADIRKLV